MFCRRGLRSVLRNSKLNIVVRRATGLRRMSNIGAQKSESSPDTNNPSLNYQNASPSFEELVFCPNGLPNSFKYLDCKYSAANSKYDVSSQSPCCVVVNMLKKSINRQKKNTHQTFTRRPYKS